jgi:hypothetical protein
MTIKLHKKTSNPLKLECFIVQVLNLFLQINKIIIILFHFFL